MSVENPLDAAQSAASQAGQVFSRKASGLTRVVSPLHRVGLLLRSAQHHPSQLLPALVRDPLPRREHAHSDLVYGHLDPIRCHLHLLLIRHAPLGR